ncbi:hypothetical protein EYF80_030925 [Liparis tanakae]|uniref:Uncharacterized protein n=1 Tax=Liparis tanakae TaxID=230148 RepID=A0A4Z2H1V1_9TELE|nr:hypothetical protein EYF80_030925 [Liparis tanakae]
MGCSQLYNVLYQPSSLPSGFSVDFTQTRITAVDRTEHTRTTHSWACPRHVRKPHAASLLLHAERVLHGCTCTVRFSQRRKRGNTIPSNDGLTGTLWKVLLESNACPMSSKMVTMSSSRQRLSRCLSTQRCANV